MLIKLTYMYSYSNRVTMYYGNCDAGLYMYLLVHLYWAMQIWPAAGLKNH